MNNEKTTTYLSTAMIAIGFVLIVLAWNGAASTAFVDSQIPYVVSGGLAGIGLIICGCTLALAQELRRAAATIAERVDAAGRTAVPEADGNPLADTLPQPRDLGAGSTIVREVPESV